MSLADEIAAVIEKYAGGSNKQFEPKGEGSYEDVRISKSVNTEKRQFTAVVLRPDVPDLHGDIYDADVVEDACHNYNQFCQKANLQHLVHTDKATVVESGIAHASYELGEGRVEKGDWVMTMKIHDDDLWEMCKEGKFTGFSVGCLAVTEEIND